MNWRVHVFLLFAVTFWILYTAPPLLSQDEFWKKIDAGLFLSEINSQRLTLLKIETRHCSFKLLSASENNKLRLTAKQWCQTHNLVSAINAGMFQTDGLTNVGYMKNFNHTNSPRLNTGYKAVLAFNPVDATVPEVQIIDLKCQDFEKLRDKYQTFIQGIRMASCRQENVWERRDKIWSIASFGMDRSGNGLFVFADSPYSVHDLTNILLSLPISLYNAMYLEGGPEATLYLSTKGIELEKVGGYELGLNENDLSKKARPIPNVIGIVKKSRQGP